MSSYGSESVGDNIEFTAVNTGDYTIIFNQTGTDTEFTKYASGNSQTARKFTIRTNQSVDLVETNSIIFTNPVTIIINKAHTEERNVPVINKIKLRTGVANTTIKVRWF